MDTNSIPYLEHASQFATAVVHQIQSWPSAVLLGACLIILGWMLKSARFMPNKYIPFILLSVGTVSNLAIGDISKVDPTQRNPQVILAMWGFCVAFAAWMSHALILKRFEKFLPIINGNDQSDQLNQKP